ncbi:hypothetical protein GCM10028807_51270 [Spirosoma daeguense]
MKYRAITSLKKADTEGRVPQHTLDQYVRNELSIQLVNALKPHLSIVTNSKTNVTNQETVDFTAELLLVQSHQWQAVSRVLSENITLLKPDDQNLIRQFIDQIETQ